MARVALPSRLPDGPRSRMQHSAHSMAKDVFFSSCSIKQVKAKSEASVGDGAASSGACGHPSAWPVLRRLPWPRRFLAKAIRGPEPGAQVLEPLHLTRILGPPPDVYLHSLLSFFVFLYLSVCEASKLRSLPFTHPIYVASRYFQ